MRCVDCIDPYTSLSDINSFAGYFVSGIIARFAVPFFLIVSGYFYFDKLTKSGPKAIFVYLKKIILIYSVWSIPYLLLELVAHFKEEPIWNILGRFLVNFLFFGSRYHFWYFPALIYSVIIFTLLYTLFRKKIFPFVFLSIILFVIGCLMSCYMDLGNQIPLIQQLNSLEKSYVIRRIFFTALPFLMLGSVIKAYSSVLLTWNRRTSIILLVAFSALFLAEMLVLHFVFGVEEVQCFSLYILVAMILIVLLQHPVETKNKAGYYSRLLANFTYYIHSLFIFGVQRASAMIGYGIQDGTLMFLIVVALCPGIGLVLSKTPVRKWIA